MKRVLLVLLLIACSQPVLEEANVTSSSMPAVDTVEVVQELPPVIEKQPSQESKPVENVSVPIGRQLLDEAKTKFQNSAYQTDDRLVMRVGDKVRHYFLKLGEFNKTPITDVYVDLSNKSALAYCNIEREGRMVGESFEYERSRCKDYIDVAMVVPFDEWVPNGPLEYLEKYANLTPSIVEDNVQTISIGGSSKTIQPSLHYTIDGKTIVLRIDKRYKLPLRIETQGKQAIDFREAYYDVMVINEKQQKLDKSWVTYEPVSEYWKKQSAK